MTVALHVRLIGVLALHDATGRDCTPRGSKARGLIGLLALTPDRRRPRRWIEARLWSDRGPEQASGSLRQTLVELRSALGKAADALVTDREAVGLLGLTTDLEADPDAARAALRAGHDLMEGCDLRDPAFLAWLREQRARLAGGAAVIAAQQGEEPEALPMLIRMGALSEGFGGFLPLALAEAIGALVSDFAMVDVFGPRGATVRVGPRDRGLVLTLETSVANGELHIMVGMMAAHNGQALWSRHAVLPLDKADLVATGEFPAIVFEAAEVVLTAMPRLVGHDSAALQAEAMMSRAVKEIFSFDAARLRNADLYLREALALAPSARANAWRGYLRQTQAVERTEENRAQMTDEANLYSRRAMEAAPTNSLVLALASHVQVMVQDNPDIGIMLARDAIALGPNNAFGYSAQAGSLLRQNRAADALASARRALALASRSAFLPSLEVLAGLAAISTGATDEAILHFEAARARAPKSRPPLRHLLFLYASIGEVDKAARVLADLRKVEPDFSLDRIRDDPAYPAGTLRRTGLLKLPLPE